MRATAQDKDAAAMMGIDVNRTISFTFLIAGGLAGAGGVIFAFYATTIGFNTGFTLGLFAFTAAVLGGIGNLPGAVLGRSPDRPDPELQRGSVMAHAGLEVDGVARVRDPDPDPRLPATGPARRAHARGQLGAPSGNRRCVSSEADDLVPSQRRGTRPEGALMTSSAWAGGPPAMWRRQSPLLRRTIMALSISAILLVLAATGHIQRSKELALIIAVVLLAFLARAIYVGFWRGLERSRRKRRAGPLGARSPRSVQRAVLPLVIAAIVILVVWAAGLAPDPSLIVLLAITYALYLMPRTGVASPSR